MIRILHIANKDDKGGSFKCLCELLQAEKTSGKFEIAVLTPMRTGLNDYCDSHDILNYSSFFLPYLYTVNSKKACIKYFIRYVQYILFQNVYSKRVAKVINIKNYDLIHTNNSANDIGSILANKYKIKHIWHLREDGLKQFSYRPFQTNFKAKNKKRKDIFIAVSRKVKEDWVELGIRSNQISVIYDGIPIENKAIAKTPVKDGIIKILMLGRLTEQKGQLNALKALNKLSDELKQTVHIDFWGEEDDKYAIVLRQYVTNNSLENNVSFRGYTTTVGDVIPQYDMGITCSRDEAYGRTTIEYMMHGLPVLVSNSGASPELLASKKVGEVFDYASNNDLKEKLSFMISNISNYDRDYIRNYAIEKFSYEKSSEMIIRLFEQCQKL